MYSERDPSQVRGVAPFGHLRIIACCQLPEAFRRLLRPSSPLTAKASTVCAYSLDHIILNDLVLVFRPSISLFVPCTFSIFKEHEHLFRDILKYVLGILFLFNTEVKQNF
jgi:hypothetical protein